MLVDLESGFIIYIFTYVLYYLKKIRNLPLRDKIIHTCFFIYICALIEVTLLPLPLSKEKILYNLEVQDRTDYIQLSPFTMFVGSHASDIFRNYFLNMIKFMPMGVFLSLKYKSNHKLIKPITLIFLTSLTIETLQYFTSKYLGTFRICDVDDLIFNFLGGLLALIVSNCVMNVITYYQNKTSFSGQLVFSRRLLDYALLSKFHIFLNLYCALFKCIH